MGVSSKITVLAFNFITCTCTNHTLYKSVYFCNHTCTCITFLFSNFPHWQCSLITRPTRLEFQDCQIKFGTHTCRIYSVVLSDMGSAMYMYICICTHFQDCSIGIEFMQTTSHYGTCAAEKFAHLYAVLCLTVHVHVHVSS